MSIQGLGLSGGLTILSFEGSIRDLEYRGACIFATLVLWYNFTLVRKGLRTAMRFPPIWRVSSPQWLQSTGIQAATCFKVEEV